MGVKSLWKLLNPVGRPVLLETMEGKILAIDSSIWIYQFQATMRDVEGKLLVNAHILGFLRRICKLLFHGIKPVFVFDGGAPTLKRSTINERKRKKSGAATTHIKVAERLLAAQMRREAVEQVQHHSAPKSSKGKGKAPKASVTIDENAVYLEDWDNPMPKTPAKPTSSEGKEPESSGKKKARFHDHDPYRLPDMDFEKTIARASSSAVLDPRLATEQEMREFIEQMRPEDFDVSAPEFRELPTEVQYEIVGDLRLQSRQTSYKRLQNMLRNAPTPLDFSKEQIKNLKQRNKLTQQLLITTDSIGKAHVEIPIRIASERNREYILKKNEGESGGWILGMRDEGTQEKPIILDSAGENIPSTAHEDSDDDMEEVAIPTAVQREMALSAIAGRVEHSKPVSRKKVQPLFDLDEDDELRKQQEDMEDDPALALAIQESLEHKEASDLQHVMDASQQDIVTTPLKRTTNVIQEDEVFSSPGRLETALAIANAGPLPSRISSLARPSANFNTFGKPSLLLSNPATLRSTPTESDDDMEEVPVVTSLSAEDTESIPNRLSRESSLDYVELETPQTQDVLFTSKSKESLTFNSIPSDYKELSHSDDDMEEVIIRSVPPAQENTIDSPRPSSIVPRSKSLSPLQATFTNLQEPNAIETTVANPFKTQEDELDHEEPFTDWSRSPSPVAHPAAASLSDTPINPPPQAEEHWDAAQEMDPEAEQGEFARFMSQMKGRDLDDVRREIEDEIKGLKQQKKIAMRDSDDITQNMITQIMIMLRLFGIPYITAPMEAEAQCAELVSLGLVEGIITDDSDVFLFGGHRVFRNMFNQSKTVECYHASDLQRELGLDRDTLVRLAYLLGSDYVEGLPGVGPVVAMELVKEFPGSDGLHKFKDWWTKVQTGRDKLEDNKSKFRKRFKKRFKDLYLSTEWPIPAVRDAYFHPTVDESDEPFKWGLPDLDGLRGLLHEELNWNQRKVDDLLLPVIQKVNKRGQAAALNKQGNLDGFFDITGTEATYAPRKRHAYASKRLQQVVTDYRNEQKLQASEPEPSSRVSDYDEHDDKGPPTKKRKLSRSTFNKRKPGTGPTSKRGGGSASKKTKNVESPEGESSDEDFVQEVIQAPTQFAAQLRPRSRRRPMDSQNI